MPCHGVLSLQGGFRAHGEILSSLGHDPVYVRTARELESVDSLIIPGGESTVLSRLLDRNGLFEALQLRCREGLPVFGTCAGMILLSAGAEGSDVRTLDLMDFKVKRNAYGRQTESFEAAMDWRGESFSALFIRAPEVSSTGEQAQVLMNLEDKAVLLRQDRLLAASFHPELSGYAGIHEYFLDEVVV